MNIIKKVIFIMPHKADPNFSAKVEITRNLLETFNLDGELPPQSYPPFSIDEALQRLREAAIVVADLLKERPSCYFELGLAEALRKNIVRIAEHNTVIHQTSERDKVIYYKDLLDYKVKMQSIIESFAKHN